MAKAKAKAKAPRSMQNMLKKGLTRAATSPRITVDPREKLGSGRSRPSLAPSPEGTVDYSDFLKNEKSLNDPARKAAGLAAAKEKLAVKSYSQAAKRMAEPKSKKSKYAAPDVRNTDTGNFKAVSKYAEAHGHTIVEDRKKGYQSGARRKSLMRSLKRRTSESSRQRVLNRILSGYGQSTGKIKYQKRSIAK